MWLRLISIIHGLPRTFGVAKRCSRLTPRALVERDRCHVVVWHVCPKLPECLFTQVKRIPFNLQILTCQWNVEVVGIQLHVWAFDGMQNCIRGLRSNLEYPEPFMLLAPVLQLSGQGTVQLFWVVQMKTWRCASFRLFLFLYHHLLIVLKK